MRAFTDRVITYAPPSSKDVTENNLEEIMKVSVYEEDIVKPSERWRILKNVVVLSLAFMVHFTAYQGAANLQSSINADAGLGTASLASVYVALLISNILLPVLIIKWLGCKWAITFSFITYMPFIAAQCWPRFYTLVPAALSIGLGGGPLWCAKCIYLSVISDVWAKVSGVPADVLLVRVFGIFFMICPMSQVWGNLVSSIVLSSGNNTISTTGINRSIIPELCGANFLPNEDAVEALRSQPPEKIQIIAGIYLACMVAACLIVTFGVDSLERYDKSRTGSGTGVSGCALMTLTLKLLKEPNQLYIILITAWTGLSQAFLGADYTSSFVSCVLGTAYVGYVMVAYGLANCVSAIAFGYVVKVTGRIPVMLIATVLQTSLLVTLLVWKPHDDQLTMLFVMSALWGVCDGIFIVQISAFYGILFPGREEAAFSNLRLWESLGFILAYVYSPYLRTSSKIYILLGTLLPGVAGYLLAEARHTAAKKKEVEIIEEDINYTNCENGLDNIAFQKIE